MLLEYFVCLFCLHLFLKILFFLFLSHQDYDIGWNTTLPRFTRCFQKSIPIWLPSLLLWFFAPLETFLTLRSRDYSTNGGCPPRPIPYNRYNVSRFLVVAAIILVNSIQFGYDLYYFLFPDVLLNQVNMADLTNSLLNIFTFVSIFFGI